MSAQETEVKVKEFSEEDANGMVTSQYQIVGSKEQADPVNDLRLLIEGLAMMTHVVSRYQEEKIDQTRRKVIAEYNQLLPMHREFKFIHGKEKNVSQPGNEEASR